MLNVPTHTFFGGRVRDNQDGCSVCEGNLHGLFIHYANDVVLRFAYLALMGQS